MKIGTFYQTPKQNLKILTFLLKQIVNNFPKFKMKSFFWSLEQRLKSFEILNKIIKKRNQKGKKEYRNRKGKKRIEIEKEKNRKTKNKRQKETRKPVQETVQEPTRRFPKPLET